MIKKLLLTTISTTICFFATAQVYIDGVNMNTDTSVRYIEITHTTYPTSFGIQRVDNGRKYSRKTGLTHATGKSIFFNSPVHLIDHMEKNGWKMIRRDMIFQAWQSGVDGGYALAFLLFEKVINTVPVH